MSITYAVKAEVVDIRHDTPQANDAFLVDTNVWYWMTYSRASQADHPPGQSRIVNYPNYVNAALSAGASLHWCGLSLAELAHIIEKTEREIFARTTGFDKSRNKEFRHNHPGPRSNVVVEVGTAWEQVRTMATPVDLLVDEAAASAVLTRFQTEPVDGYDLFMLEAISRTGILQVITDDGDFCTVSGIKVFTCNTNVINTAEARGKLVTR